MSVGYIALYGVFSAIVIALVLKIVRSFNRKRHDDASASRRRRAGRSSRREGHRGSGSNAGGNFTYTPLAGGDYSYSGGAHRTPEGQCSTGAHTVAAGGIDGGGCDANGMSSGSDAGSGSGSGDGGSD